MKLAFYGVLTVCGFLMAYGFAEDPAIFREVAGMTVGLILMYIGAMGLRRIGGDWVSKE